MIKTIIEASQDYLCKLKIASELEVEKITKAAPEQYTVYYSNFAVGYIRLRNGVLKLFYTPNSDLDESAFLLYYKDFKNRNLDSFQNKPQQNKYLKICKKIIANRIIFDNKYDLSELD